MNGCVAAISVDTGKVLDIEVICRPTVQHTGSAGRRPGQSRRRATTPNEDRYLVLTARRLQNMNATLLQQHLRSASGTTVSTQTVRNRLHGLGLYAHRPMSHFSVHADNRHIFIWSDRGSRNNSAFVHEIVRFGGEGVLVYGGISIVGRTYLYIIRDGPLTARRYRDEILRPIVVPYAAAIGDDFILMDDNCRPHHANLTYICIPGFSNPNTKQQIWAFRWELIRSFLQCHSADFTLCNVTKNRVLEKRCPQWSVMGPFLLNLIRNDPLCTSSKFQNCHKIAFADDVFLIVQYKHFQDVCTLSQNILTNIFDSSELYKLELNPLKTKVMKTYKKSTVYQRINLNLEGVIIEEVQKIKYLGIIVDSKMQWKEHISYVSSKSEKMLLGLLRIASNIFGVMIYVLQLIYKQGIVPLISYAWRAWGYSLSKKINSRLIRRTQRRFLLRVIKGYKTISYEAVYAISGIPPIDVIILNNLDVRENYLSTNLGTLNGTIQVSFLPHPSCRKPITLVTYTNEVFQEYKTVCFTEGRKLHTKKLVEEVQSILYYLDCDIHFSYVRGNSGNLGNDRADQLTKEATCQDMNLLMSVPLSHWKHVAWERTVSSWNTEFLASPKPLWTKIFPTI
ncbi:transposable element Tcb2 transposase [Trichonephila clavipes]|nr:transposable element Tcb2 transposase [Trichonephila clavipes]